MTTPTRRVRITHPRTEAAQRAPIRTPSREIDEQTEIGAVYMRSLIRSQRRLATAACSIVGLVLGGIALAGGLIPAFGHAKVFGIPLPWALLGVAIYPVLIGLAWYVLRQAERNEQAFTRLVRRR
jgi:hypothetical protein